MTEWKQLDADKYLKFRRKLLKKKGGEDQRRFLKKVLDSQSFLREMKGIKIVGKESPVLLEHRFCEGEFNNPPACSEERIFERWENLSPAIAASAGFWAHLILQHIEEKKIEASFLASGNQPNQTGVERIERVLSDWEKSRNPKPENEGEKAESEKAEKAIDDCVRNILRNLGGLPEVRGKRSVISDCPFSRAWWRQRLLIRAAVQSGISAKVLGRAIRKSKTHWEKLVAAMVSRNPVLGYSHVQYAIIVAMVPIFENPNSKVAAKYISKICQEVCFLGGYMELGILDYEEVLKLIEPIVARTMSKHDLSQ